ncbi:MAG: fasciclin domain-containing protein [Bacteroidetes bacterium]|nr:fasciclin domain-containing protein [Bacteroidota bacterium]
MIKTKSILATAIVLAGISLNSVIAQTKESKMDNIVMVGGEAMYPMKDIVSNAVNSKDHTTLVAAVKTAGLVETLQSKGPFTVFAPVNNAFEDLPAGTVENLLKPENKAALSGVLTYHVLAGKYSYSDIALAIKKGNGLASMKTVNGQSLTFMMNGMHNITVKDEIGNMSNISTYDVMQSNGIIHVLDKVLMPKM